MAKGRKILSVSLTLRAYDTVVKYCEEHDYSRSRFIEQAVLEKILENLTEEVEHYEQEKAD